MALLLGCHKTSGTARNLGLFYIYLHRVQKALRPVHSRIYLTTMQPNPFESLARILVDSQFEIGGGARLLSLGMYVLAS